MHKLAEKYYQNLTGQVIPFWEKFSIDTQCGGYFSCLNRDGTVFDTDKFMWMQARELWTFSMLYNRFKKKEKWLELAGHGFDFLKKHGCDENGNWYFALTRAGAPYVQPYNIFSDCFAAMAFSQYGLAADSEEARNMACETFQNILKRQLNPKGRFSKIVPGTRPIQSFAMSMILCNLVLEMEWLLSADQVEKTIQENLDAVMGLFLDESRNLIHEFAAPDGSFPDCYDGRLINPGHGIEGMWFVMDLAVRKDDKALINKAVDVVLSTLDFGWDDKYGGVFYFLDALGNPPRQLEWSLKLWWPHLEALVALARAFRLTGRQECREWFEKVEKYTWDRFPDGKYGGWFGYMDRRGDRLFDLKGSEWKGFFHVPRALLLCYRELEMCFG